MGQDGHDRVQRQMAFSDMGFEVVVVPFSNTKGSSMPSCRRWSAYCWNIKSGWGHKTLAPQLMSERGYYAE